jgi:cytidylate kinase
MPIVTISRQYGAGGSSVAGIVAAALGADVIDKILIDEVASRLSLESGEVEAESERPEPLLERLSRSLSTMPMVAGAGWTPPYPDPLFDPRKAIVELTQDAIKDAAKGGNVVIVGRGAGFLLHDRPGIFRVFLRASESVRAGVLMERLHLDQATARRKMHETDANRAAYIKQLYKRDWCDPDEYDLVLNTGRMGYQTAAEMILLGVREVAAMPAS